jgi:hypothetical protein
MPKCTPCLGTIIKQAIIDKNPSLAPVMGYITDCEQPLDMEFCASSKGRKGKREPSAYNIFVKQCMLKHGGVKAFGDAAGLMKKCAGEWREQKGK